MGCAGAGRRVSSVLIISTRRTQPILLSPTGPTPISASARLLATTEPGILDTLSRILSTNLPSGDDGLRDHATFLPCPKSGARRRREARDVLLVGPAEQRSRTTSAPTPASRSLAGVPSGPVLRPDCRALGYPRGEGDRASSRCGSISTKRPSPECAAAGISSSPAIGCAPARAA